VGLKVLLFSGGMDSWLINQLWNPDILLYININNQYSKEEIKRLPDNVIIENLDLSKWEREDKIIPLRNLYFLAMATNYGNEICLGATNGDRVLDKTYEFKKKYEKLLNYLFQKQHWTEKRTIKINLDFKKYTKTQLLKKYINKNGDIKKAFHESFSCYNPIKGKECWQCKPCFRKYVAFKNNGFVFNKKTEDKVKKFINKFIIPQIENKTYNRKKEEKEILQAIGLK